MDANEPASIVHEACDSDFEDLCRAVRKTIAIFDVLQREGVVGHRVEPPLDIDLNDKLCMKEWMKTNVGTVYHWMSTCKAGVDKIRTVANEHFVVRNGLTGLVRNLRIGSGAVLPEISEANPHVTIATFSVALAHALFQDRLSQNNLQDVMPSDLVSGQLSGRMNCDKEVLIRRVAEVRPDLWPIAKEHQRIFTAAKETPWG